MVNIYQIGADKSMKLPGKGLYAITPTQAKTDAQIIDDVIAIIKGGACMLQYRDKRPKSNIHLARQLLQICRTANIPLIINDRIDLAETIGADGVHLGKNDTDIVQARKRLGPEMIIGISCYNDLNRALEAENLGASYVAFGRFFPSSSKPLASPAHIDILRQAKTRITIPVVAIGGILPENAPQLLAAGANMLAVIGGLFNECPEQSARRYQLLFSD